MSLSNFSRSLSDCLVWALLSFWNQNNENGPTKAQLGSIAVNSEYCGLEYVIYVNVQFCLLL